MIVVVEGMSADRIAKVDTVRGKYRFRQCLRSADQIAVDTTALPTLAGAILYSLHLHVVPIRPERRENAAVMRHVPVPVRGAFPYAHCGEMRWLQAGDVPLIDAVVGNASKSDFAV